MLYLGSDHGGFTLKSALLSLLQKKGIPFFDVGTYTSESCDYPTFAKKVSIAVQQNPSNRGVLICTSGVGMSIVANKHVGVYAGLVTTLTGVQKACQHNAINVLCLPGELDSEFALQLIEVFLNTPADNADKYQRRRAQTKQIESKA